MAPELVDRLKNILLAMHEDEEGRSILKSIDNTTKFDVPPGGESQVRKQFMASFDVEMDE